MKENLQYLAFINLLDGLLTFFGIRLWLIEEVNLIMDFIYTIEPLLFLSVKAVFSGFLILLSTSTNFPTQTKVKVLARGAAYLY
ncbi:DUF5658 family protein [Cytobacillus oceanisediminis]|uniref:DUF5658 domain-containing protein n=1 Tax=Cytobacillus oceanisediminis 2691 TaxID=1196031 RepID=A0A160M7V8_9BACI|nr:DUF5658 family protein [Cytobacillus oceanisediminis]AND38627.1 hypothetical protein A361_05640 [Cytobacillus oceanisediminis 2691]